MATDGKQGAEFERLQEELRKRYGCGSLYEALGVKPDATDKQIKDKYREKARLYHSDSHKPNKPADAERRMRDLNSINEILSSPKKKASYDEWLRMASAAAGSGGASSKTNAPPSAEAPYRRYQRQETGRESGSQGKGGSGVFVNGVELPPEFRGASVVNNIAISPDGKWFARVSNGAYMVGAMPQDGRLNTDGYEIKYEGGRVSVSGKGSYVSGRRVHVSQQSGVHNVVFGFGFANVDTKSPESLEHGVDRMYERVKRVNVGNSVGDVALGFSGDGKVHVRGAVSGSEPEYHDGTLFVNELEGELLLPREDKELKVDITTLVGNIKGNVAHKGRITCGTGDIRIGLYAPLIVWASTVVGRVNIKGMIYEGGGRYTPPDTQPEGLLEVQGTTGDVKVEYVAERQTRR